MTQIAFPEGVTTIHYNCLVDCDALKTITVPSTAKTVDYHIVSDCSNLERIEYNAINATWDGAYSYLFFCSGDTDGLEVVFANNIQSIPLRFMYDCSVRSVVFPAGIEKIPERAFYGCTQLHSLTIPKSVAAIDDDAFGSCTGLTEIYFHAANMKDLKATNGVFADAGQKGNGIAVMIGEAVTRIPAYLFCPYSSSNGDPKITDIQFGNNVLCTSVGDYAFGYCASLPSVDIPHNVKTIGQAAFYKCTGLTGVSIGFGVETIGESAFFGCESLSTITIPDNVTAIGEAVFSDCTSLTAVTIGSGITQIASHAFSGCTGLPGIAIPDGITEIDYCAFSGCSGLTNITIQDSVTDIALNAFQDCDKLESVIYCGTEIQWNAIDIGIDNAALTDAPRKYHDFHDGSCTVCGVEKCVAHTWQDGVCVICAQQLAEAMDLNSDGSVTAFDAQILAEAKAGLRNLTNEQWEALGDLRPEHIVDYILGEFSSTQ